MKSDAVPEVLRELAAGGGVRSPAIGSVLLALDKGTAPHAHQHVRSLACPSRPFGMHH